MARCRGGVRSKPLHRARPHRRRPARPHAPRHRIRQQGTALPDPARAIATRSTRRRLCLRPRTECARSAAATRGRRNCRPAPRRHGRAAGDNCGPAGRALDRRCASGARVGVRVACRSPVSTRLRPRRAARERRAGSGCRPVPGSSPRPANGPRRDAPRALRTGARGAVGRRPHVARGHLRRWPGNVRPARRPPVLVTLRSAAAALPRSNRRGDTAEPAGASAGRHRVPDVRRRAGPDCSRRDTRSVERTPIAIRIRHCVRIPGATTDERHTRPNRQRADYTGPALPPPHHGRRHRRIPELRRATPEPGME